MPLTILQNDFKRQWEQVRAPVLAAVERVGASGWYILGREVEAFETALAEFWGIARAVGVANGMDALEIGLRCLNLQRGQKVLTTPLSAFATTLAILRAGGVPVFVDVDDRGAVDLRQCRELLERDETIRFLVPVHLYGFPVPMAELQRLKEDFALSVVEDCAQAIGASDTQFSVGSVGQVAATSLYPTKNLGAFGDAGALLTNDADIQGRAKALRNYGQTALYRHAELGLNSRLDEVHAAIVLDALLPMLQAWTETRREIAARYLEQIQNQSITLMQPRLGMEPVWHLFPVTVPERKREAFREHLRGGGVATGFHYPQIIPDQPAISGVAHEIAVEPVNARRLASCEISLPIHPFLTDAEVDSVIALCNEWSP
ncbi:MAG: DegT/DnrJ/EryC1/StrS family aminotransferase [Verrucomicrobiota bacterium]|nr:DegT/DnrJ/EryC1/StrS family aminotransferase [Verrucomicrobiota bacterium]